MSEELIEPETIPSLDDINFGDVEESVRRIQRTAVTLEHRAGEMDGAWAVGVGLHYLAPNGVVLSEKLLPVKQNASAVAEASQTTAGALHSYAIAGAPIKKALKQLKGDAEHLVAQAKPLGDGWRHKRALVEENDRITTSVRHEVRAHDEAQRDAAEKINATNDGPGANWAERGHEDLGWGGYGTTGLGAAVTWSTRYRYGTFKPNGYMVNGRYGYLPWKNDPLWKNTWRRMWSKNWQAKAGDGATRARWLKVGKWGGRTSVGLTAVTSGLSQWGQDSQDKNMPTGKKVARTGMKSAATAGGAWGGAEVGAASGGAIGAAFGGVGAPIGATIGGLAGAAVGSGVGSTVSDWFNEGVLGR